MEYTIRITWERAVPAAAVAAVAEIAAAVAAAILRTATCRSASKLPLPFYRSWQRSLYSESSLDDRARRNPARARADPIRGAEVEVLDLAPDRVAAGHELVAAALAPTMNSWRNDPSLDRGNPEEARVDPADRDPNRDRRRVARSRRPDPPGRRRLKFLFRGDDDKTRVSARYTHTTYRCI